MCGPFKGIHGILRLLEIIFSTLALIIVLFRGWMVSPWGVWCEFVWFFCITVAVVLTVMEAMSWNVLLVAFLPDWADLTCGLTTVCAVTIISATIIFGIVFICSTCVGNILCLIFSFVATIVFVVDAILRWMKLPKGYMCSIRGCLRMSEAFVACIIITATIDHLVMAEWHFRPFTLILCVPLFLGCLLVTVAIIILNLLSLLQCLLSFALKLMEFVFNIVAVLSYLLAIILWCVFAYIHNGYSPYICHSCYYADVHTVAIGAILNLILYVIDLVLTFKAR